MQIRNPKINRHGSIDCEIEHPVYGWIPFTADPNDVEPHGRKIHEVALGLSPEPYVEPVLEIAPTPVPQVISFAQLLIGLVTEKWITEFDGDNWLDGKLPAPVNALIAAMPKELQFTARAKAKRPSEILRTNQLVNSMAINQKRTDKELDDLFIKYSEV